MTRFEPTVQILVSPVFDAVQRDRTYLKWLAHGVKGDRLDGLLPLVVFVPKVMSFSGPIPQFVCSEFLSLLLVLRRREAGT